LRPGKHACGHFEHKQPRIAKSETEKRNEKRVVTRGRPGRFRRRLDRGILSAPGAPPRAGVRASRGSLDLSPRPIHRGASYEVQPLPMWVRWLIRTYQNPLGLSEPIRTHQNQSELVCTYQNLLEPVRTICFCDLDLHWLYFVTSDKVSGRYSWLRWLREPGMAPESPPRKAKY
jgi:hypothetical protein